MAPDNDAPNILVLCTANVCRSPMAEALLTRALTAAGVEANVSSAGFLEGGRRADDDAIAVMRSLGFDISAHRSQEVTRPQLVVHDLILTMTRAHIRSLDELWPEARSRAFTLGSVAVAETGPASLDPDELDEWTRALDAARDPNDLLGTGHDETRDPLGRPRRVFAQTAQQLSQRCQSVARILAGGHARSALPGAALAPGRRAASTAWGEHRR